MAGVIHGQSVVGSEGLTDMQWIKDKYNEKITEKHIIAIRLKGS
jgi:hypothetical protein